MKFGLQKSTSSTNLSSSHSSTSYDSKTIPKLPAFPFPVVSDPGSAQSSNHASFSSSSDWSILQNGNSLDSNSNGQKVEEKIKKKESSGKNNSSSKTNDSSNKSSSGFDRFVKRVRSVSMGTSSNKKLTKEKVLPLPPLPYSLGTSSKGVGGINFDLASQPNRIIRKGSQNFDSMGSTGIPSGEDSFDHKPPTTPRRYPSDEADLASLLYQVQSAGDKFSSNDRLNHSPPFAPPSRLNNSRSYSSLNLSQESSKLVAPSISPSTSTSPRPYLSYLSPNSSPSASPILHRHLPTPPLSPLRTTTFPPSSSKQEDGSDSSEDDYGSSHNEITTPRNKNQKSSWLKSPNSRFASAISSPDEEEPSDSEYQVPVSSSKSRGKFPEKGKGLGPVARELSDLTILRIRSGDKILDELQRPLSINLMSKLNGKRDRSGMRVVLGRILMRKKFKRGLSMLEGIELERSSRINGNNQISTLLLSQSTESDLDDVAIESSLNPFSSTPASTATLDAPILPLGMSTPSSLEIWLARPTFIRKNLVTISVEGGFLIDLIRPTKSQPPTSYSNRIKYWSNTELIAKTSNSRTNIQTQSTKLIRVEGKELKVPRTSGEGKKQISILERRGSLPISGIPLSIRVESSNSNSVLNESKAIPIESDDDEDQDIPLAYLQQRPDSTISSAPLSPQPYLTSSNNQSSTDTQEVALQKAEAKSTRLEEEVIRMKYQEQATKDRQLQIDTARIEDAKNAMLIRREREAGKREERRLAEERRRCRAMGLEVGLEGGLPKVSRVNNGVQIVHDDFRSSSSSMSKQFRRNSVDYSSSIGGGENFPSSFSQSQPQSQFLSPTNGYGINPWANQQHQYYNTLPNQFYNPNPMLPMYLPPQPFYAQPRFSISSPDLQLLSSQYQTPYSPLTLRPNFTLTPQPIDSHYQQQQSPSPSPKFPPATTTVKPPSPRRLPLNNHKQVNSNQYRPESSASLRTSPPNIDLTKKNRRISTATALSSRPQQQQQQQQQLMKNSPSTPNLESKSMPRHVRTTSGGVAFLNSAEQRLQFEKERRLRLEIEAKKQEGPGKRETFLRL